MFVHHTETKTQKNNAEQKASKSLSESVSSRALFYEVTKHYGIYFSRIYTSWRSCSSRSSGRGEVWNSNIQINHLNQKIVALGARKNYLFICLFACLFFYLFVFFFIYLFVYLFHLRLENSKRIATFNIETLFSRNNLRH